jgi:hypothetical protein
MASTTEDPAARAAAGSGTPLRQATEAAPTAQTLARRRDLNAEARIQAAIVEWLRAVAPHVIAFAVPNGGLRSKAEAARLKWTGGVAGVPDLVIVVDPGRIFFIEVKTPGGSVSGAQRQFMFRLDALRTPCAIVRSTNDMHLVFRLWGIATREATTP